MSEPIYYKTPMVDPYRLTLNQNTAAAIIPQPGAPPDVYAAAPLSTGIIDTFTVPSNGPTNIQAPPLSSPGVDPITQPTSSDTAAADPVQTAMPAPVSKSDTPAWFVWVKAHPLQSAAIAAAAVFLINDLLKTQKSK